MGPGSAHGGQPIIVRVRDVTEAGFEYRIQEWDYLDGIHIPIELSWIAGTVGFHKLADGSKIALGTSTASGILTEVDVSAAGFSSTPLALAQISSDANASALVERVDSVTVDAVKVRLQNEEANTAAPIPESVSWFAFEDASDGIVNTGLVTAHHRWTETLATENFAFFADMPTSKGNNPATVRYRDKNGTIDIKTEEERSRDAKVRHVPRECRLAGN